MKLTKLNKLVLFGLLFTIAAVGCRTKPTPTVTQLNKPAATGGTPAEINNGNPSVNDGDKLKSENINNTAFADPNLRKDWPRDHEIFKADIVHFDFDSSVIRGEEKSKVAAVADYMKANNLDAVQIEGHCDERGTEEYNRSLGERRALALREELIRLGIEGSRIDTMSYGEDRPAEIGHNEPAYRKNRRGEFVLEKHQTLVGLNGPIENNDAIK